MATINVKDAAGSTVALEKPLTPGQTTMSASRPVAIASDQSSIPVAATLAAETTKVIGTIRTASGGIASGSVASGAVASGAYAAGSLAAGAGVDGWDLTQGAIADAAVTAGATGSISAKLRSISRDIGSLVVAIGSTAWDLGVGTGGTRTQRVSVDTAQLAALATTSQAMSAGYQLVGLPTDLTWPKGLSNKAFVAAFTTLTRPANTTAYTALDSISDNATAGSVTALSATVSDTNDDPIFVNEILVSSTDTGLAGKRVRAYLFNSDPTASTGVGGGDNAAYSQKKAGYLGSFSGVLETGFSDGTVGRLVPTFADGAAAGTPHAMAGGFVTVKPTSGAKTLFIQYQAVDGFTPSANSTTIIGTARGWQGRAA